MITESGLTAHPAPGDDIGTLLFAGLNAPARRSAEAVMRCSVETGVPAWVVGGPVRDILLGRAAVDLDIVIEGDGPAFARELARREGGEAKEYARFWTALVILPGGGNVDVTTARQESYPAPGDLPEVAVGDIVADMYRRDFTVNAMAVRLGPDRAGEFLDPAGGVTDLAAGIIRALHDGSFRDDPTRILRAIRFEARYGFRLEDRTRELLAGAVAEGCLDTVSRQRLRTEIVAILTEREPARSIAQLHEAGVWKALFGPTWHYPEERIVAAFGRVDEAAVWYAGLDPEEEAGMIEPWIVLWLLLMTGTDPGEAQMRAVEFHLGRQAQRCTLEAGLRGEAARTALTDPEAGDSRLFRALTGLESETVLALVLQLGAEPAVRERVGRFVRELRGIDPLITGDDIVTLGAREGPQVGEVLRRLLAARLEGEIFTREGALALARRILDELAKADR